ncbi:hypothetical protein VTK73DRAFT_4873 [Phialemonium thermophilum]|uniref:Major facilitator superfamily (MFS) profile domain-containing protein n=1 Tax=Phialemonium thermophilum TaxID=223376 RepID=A0ABR3WRF3_9PEZI
MVSKKPFLTFRKRMSWPALNYKSIRTDEYYQYQWQDRTIIVTAVPKITTEFHSLNDIGWYGSSYLLTSCCFQLMFGKLYAEFNVKWVFLIALAIFEVGSTICAAAPNSTALIVGRAVAGLGSSGLATGAFTILTLSVPLHNRPKVTGIIGGASGIAQILAPTLGGVFTTYTTWRWCFWINLPLGAVTAVVIAVFVHPPAPPRTEQSGNKLIRALEKFDYLGTVFLFPALVCLLLALQWGGTTYAWNNWRVVLTLCVFGVCFGIWGYLQVRQGDRATIPVRMVAQRSMACALWFMFCTIGLLYVVVQFVPIWFQAIRRKSASESGVDLLAATLPQTATSLSSGFITSKIGYYVPALLCSTVATSVATGLISQFGLHTSQGYWIASLVVFGFGVGAGLQQTFLVPQVVLTGADVPRGLSLILFIQTLSGSIFSSVASNILDTGLVQELAHRAPQVNPQVVIGAGSSDLVQTLAKVYPQHAGIALALSCKYLYHTLYPPGKLPSLNECQLVQLLLLLERDLPRHYLCLFCTKLQAFEPDLETGWRGQKHEECEGFHRRLQEEGEEEDEEEDSAEGGYVRSLVPEYAGFDRLGVTFHEAHLVMNRHFYGAGHGLRIETMRRHFQLDRYFNSETWHFAGYYFPHFPLERHFPTPPGCPRLDIPVCTHLVAHVQEPRKLAGKPHSDIWRPIGYLRFNRLRDRQFRDCDAVDSCCECPTDYEVSLRGESSGTSTDKREYDLAITTYHRLGQCRTPFEKEWLWLVKEPSHRRVPNDNIVEGEVRERWLRSCEEEDDVTMGK